MKPYLLALLSSLVLSTPLSGYYEKAKDEIGDLKFTAKVNSVFIGYPAYYATGSHEAYKLSLVVISMWERKYQPRKAPKFKIKDTLLVLMAISNEMANEGFETVEESWTSQGFKHGLERSLSILEGKPFAGDGLYH
jgi:hypothetical protein